METPLLHNFVSLENEGRNSTLADDLNGECHNDVVEQLN